MKTRLATLLILVVLLTLACLEAAQCEIVAPVVDRPVITNLQPISSTIARIRSSELQANIGKSIIIEGFYYDGSIPMVIDDFTKVQMDRQIPKDSYVPVVGLAAGTVKWGDRISLTGTLLKPAADAPASLRTESSYLKISGVESIKVISPTKLSLSSLPKIVATAGGTITVVQPGSSSGSTTTNPPAEPNKYAVLVVGGGDAANNHIRYWNDLKVMYGILRSAGYAADKITVLYYDGVARDSSMPVNYASTRANVATVFNQLAGKVTATDQVYIMLNDHGGPGCLCMLNWDNMPANEFAAQVAKINQANRITIQMKQCFSGCFIAPLTGPRRIIMSSCSPDEVSWSHMGSQYGEFTFWYFSALRGSKPDGSGSVNADTNGDGKVSILEAYNFARSHDAMSETPFYEDDGAQPCHSGAMPNNGEGNLGIYCQL